MYTLILSFSYASLLLCNIKILYMCLYFFQCFQYRTEHAQDVKKLEKLTNQLMRHMASKEKS